MRLKCRLNFIEPWSTIIPDVAKQCNMTVEEYCRRAVQVITKQGLSDVEVGEVPDQQGDTHAREELLHNTGTDLQAQPQQATDSDALPDENHA